MARMRRRNFFIYFYFLHLPVPIRVCDSPPANCMTAVATGLPVRDCWSVAFADDGASLAVGGDVPAAFRRRCGPYARHRATGW
jgi:hypothetical protein